jgi:hypothetical protein
MPLPTIFYFLAVGFPRLFSGPKTAISGGSRDAKRLRALHFDTVQTNLDKNCE